MKLSVNGRSVDINVSADTALLWVLRDNLGLTGTKFGCGKGLCGACTIHLDGTAARSCQTQVSDAIGRKIVTIEGLGGHVPQRLQRAWIDEQVPQCGYCQSGQIMQAAALLAQKPHPSGEEIVSAMSGNLCRCMTYNAIRRAIARASAPGG